jgi:hypothetical protein
MLAPWRDAIGLPEGFLMVPLDGATDSTPNC